MTRLQHPISLSLILCLVVASLLPLPRTALADNEQPSAPQEDATDEGGLRFRLSQALDQPEARQPTNVAQTTALSESETANILGRLPAIKSEASDEAEFALREGSLPPPRTGKTINISFPASEAAAPDTTALGSLEVVRYSPAGEVALAPNLSVTFSQPMIALSSQEEAAANVPVKLAPQPEGKWRWVGTRTLLFEPAGRFSMATAYSVTIPAGTRSANGGALAQSKSWAFTTPPPTLKSFFPPKTGVQRRDTLIFAEFDQRIDPAQVLRQVKVEGGGIQAPIRLATSSEIESDKSIRALTQKAASDRWLVFRAVNPAGDPTNALPAGANIVVSFTAGLPSAEGPGTTKDVQSFAFDTFGPLHVTGHTCGYENRCRPDDSWAITFSNPLDARAPFDGSRIKVEPKIQGLKFSNYANVVVIDGEKRGRTTYRVTLARSIKDDFGQTLGTDATVQFNVGAAGQQLFGSGEDIVLLDPFGPAQYSVYSVNHRNLKVRLYSVTPDDWPEWTAYHDDSEKQPPPGRLVYSKTISLRSRSDEMIETLIDLRPALKDAFGQMVVIIEPAVKPAADDAYGNEAIDRWIQRTEIGLDAIVDDTDLIGLATSLRDGRPLAGVKLTIAPYGITATTAVDGTVRVGLPPESSKTPPNLLVARRGKDIAILPEDAGDEGSWYRKKIQDELRWYVFDDRGLYRPGEEVHVKGWLRRISGAKDGDVGLLNNAAANVSYVLLDGQGNQVTKGVMAINALGGFDVAFKLPATMNLGYGLLKLKAEGGSGDVTTSEFTHHFRVQEFRRPEFEVSARNESDAPLFVGDHADTSVTANYFAGGGLADAEVSWNVTATAASFTPPNRDDFTFGKWMPWWESSYEPGESHSETFTGRTDAAGKHRLRIDFDSVNPPRPSTVNAEAKVTDVNRQTWAAKTTMLVHPASLYVGLKSDKTFVQRGEPLVVQSIVTDLDGRAIANREIKLRAALLDWKQENGEWKEVETNPQECAVQSAGEAVKCTFASKQGGTYRISATIRDDRERRNESELTLWVSGGKQPPDRTAAEETVTLIPDRKEYRAGETAEILVQAPFYPAEAVMTLQRSGTVRTERFRLDGPTYTLRVPIEEVWTPNIHVQVDLVGAADRDTENSNTGTAGVPPVVPVKRPAFASGEINLSIPPFSRKINVTAMPRDKALEPGGETIVNVEAKDAAGHAVAGSEVAVVVVDEAVLALTDYKLLDPVAAFYVDREGGTTDYHSRENLVLATFPGPGSGSGTGEGRGGNVGGGGPGGGGTVDFRVARGGLGMFRERLSGKPAPPNAPPPMPTPYPGSEDAPIRLRQNFNALAVFVPSVPTDANGRVQVGVKLPDNLTRYRVMAVAVAGGKQFGSGESAITARMPLMARPSAPRFLNFADRFDLPIVVQNQTDSAITVDLAVRATNAQFITALASTGRRVTVPPNDRVEVRIPAATVKAGTARFQIAAVSGRWSDAAEIELPVWTPATTEAFATYGEIDEGAITQPVKAPANVWKQFGGLEIETSSTQLQQLTDAFLYLQNYPYECSEQLSSRIISVAALRDVLTAFKVKDLPSPPEIEAAVTRDLKRLQGMQNNDGGFGFWKRGEQSWPYLSIHVAHALARARQKKFDVPREMFDQSQKYLREIDSHIPSTYGIDTRRAINAYALYVRAQMGDRDPARARQLIAEAGLDNLSLESVGWLLSVLANDGNSLNEVLAMRRLLTNRVTETAGTAHFVCSYKDGDYLLLNSDRRADGVILDALIGDQPSSDLIPKIVRGLLDHRTRGRWENTQENVFILLALDRYFNTYEKVAPNFIARVWLGNAYAGEQRFKGRSTERQQVNVPMSYLVDKGPDKDANKGQGQGFRQNLIVSKEGPGRLYYRVGMNYAPFDLNLKPADYGFTVVRTYEALDHAEDVRQNADGTWHIKAGARVRVRLTMVAPARRYHVALADPLPAGFETLNPALAVTESIPEDKKQTGVIEYGNRSYGTYGWWSWRSVWFDHQNLRDERAEAFTSLLWEGVYDYSYVARATTPGAFVVPPAKAEEMYHPETFGRGKTDRVVIE